MAEQSPSDSPSPANAPTPAADDAAVETTSAESTQAGSQAVQTESAREVEYKVPGFTPLEESNGSKTAAPMDRFYEVNVPVWAELGRVDMPLGELMKLDEGSVLRLDRPVSDPVDLVSQGVKLARGEVVVIDDCFAVRIKEMARSKPA